MAKLFVVSDIHYGNPRLGLKQIRATRLFLSKYSEELFSSDFMVVTGDLFDLLLTIGKTTEELSKFFKFLDIELSKHDVKLIVLEGTLSHDYHQFETFKELFINTEVIYSKEIDIIFSKDKSGELISFLTVPDSLNYTMDQYEEIVRNLLSKHGLEKVNFSLMHGMMKHHIDLPTVECYDQEYYGSISDFVFIGHNHRYNNYKNIYTPGSLFRDRFGEEEDKVGLYFDGEKVNKLVNIYADKYITVDLNEVGGQISHILNKNPMAKYSLVGNVTNEFKKELEAAHPTIALSYKNNKDAKDIVGDITDHVYVPITKDNILDLIKTDEYGVEEIVKLL